MATEPFTGTAQSHYFTTTDGVKIHFLTAGDRGSWVILIHGYRNSAQRMWFETGIAPVIAKDHRVVAIDCRNHGLSDLLEVNGRGKIEDVIELMDHVGIARAHIHGYSMGSAMVGILLSQIPHRFITAGFEGWGIQESDPVLKERANAFDEAMPALTGPRADRMAAYLIDLAAARPKDKPPMTQMLPPIDFAALDVPILTISGSADHPHRNSHKAWREAKIFMNVVLQDHTHISCVREETPPLFARAMAGFINAFDDAAGA